MVDQLQALSPKEDMSLLRKKVCNIAFVFYKRDRADDVPRDPRIPRSTPPNSGEKPWTT
jgi:hypothetical protein